jgi:U4/U6.U5 tri-snRNP-associated protein 3
MQQQPPATARADPDRREQERAERMARLRQEIEAEEQGVTVAASTTTVAPTKKDKKKKKRQEDDDDDEETAAMRQIMGLTSFGSTKQTAVPDNDTTLARGAMAQKKGRKYRQYMNRAGGFNRPLDQMD